MTKKEYDAKISQLANNISDMEVSCKELLSDLKNLLTEVESLPELSDLDEDESDE